MGISVLRITSNDLDELAALLDKQVNKAGGLLRELPVVIELDLQIIDVDGLLDVLRQQHVTVIGAYRAAASMEAACRRAGLPLIREQAPSRAAPKAEAPEPQAQAQPEPAAAPEPVAPQVATADTRIVTTPVRSGQRIYARGTDLVITAPVSAGAEVIADGCIHIYGSLRGRAVAGAQGDESARIFCHDLRAELLAVAGRYKVADDIPESIQGQAVQVKLDGEKLVIDAIK